MVNKFHQIFHPATKVRTQPADHIRLNVGAMLVNQLGQRHAIQTGGLGDFLKGHPSPLTKFEISDTFTQLESSHCMTPDYYLHQTQF